MPCTMYFIVFESLFLTPSREKRGRFEILFDEGRHGFGHCSCLQCEMGIDISTRGFQKGMDLASAIEFGNAVFCRCQFLILLKGWIKT